MSSFADVEQFARQHGACGGITPSKASQAGGAFLLTLTCACGESLDRWVTAEEARQPLPLSPRLVTPRARPAPGRPSSPPSSDLEAALRAAVEAEEQPRPAPRPGAASKASPAPSGDLAALVRELR